MNHKMNGFFLFLIVQSSKGGICAVIGFSNELSPCGGWDLLLKLRGVEFSSTLIWRTPTYSPKKFYRTIEPTNNFKCISGQKFKFSDWKCILIFFSIFQFFDFLLLGPPKKMPKNHPNTVLVYLGTLILL